MERSEKLGRLFKVIGGGFLCNIMGDHDWTCAKEEGIDPTPLQLKMGARGFADYATTYCKRCGKESSLNQRLL